MRNFTWKLFLGYLRQRKTKSSITRLEIREAFDIKGSRSSEITMDNYRNYLTQAGYLKKTKKRGTYSKVKQVPRNLTLTQALREAYPHNYRK
jgi:hypothetical protein